MSTKRKIYYSSLVAAAMILFAVVIATPPAEEASAAAACSPTFASAEIIINIPGYGTFDNKTTGNGTITVPAGTALPLCRNHEGPG